MINKVQMAQKDLKGIDLRFVQLIYYRGGDNRQKGPNAKADVYVTLEDLYVGAERSMNIARNVYCPKCRGTGAKGGKTKKCPKCHGQGVVM